MISPLPLLHLCDSLFPIGGFAYSDGLEAVAHRTDRASSSTSIATLESWMDAVLQDTFGCAEGPVVWRAWLAFARSDWRAIEELDGEILALRPAGSVRRSSRAMGLRLMSTWQSLHPDSRLEHALALAGRRRLGPALPVAFAAACATAAIDRRESVEGFAYTRLAATISAAMRLFAIGQTAAHALLARTLDKVPQAVDAIAQDDALPRSFAPAMDVAAMTQPYLHSRLFRS